MVMKINQLYNTKFQCLAPRYMENFNDFPKFSIVKVLLNILMLSKFSKSWNRMYNLVIEMCNLEIEIQCHLPGVYAI